MRAARDGVPGVYLMAAAVFEAAEVDAARDAVRALARGPGLKFHWRDESESRRAVAVRAVAGLEALHYVVVGGPLDGGRQERCRWLVLGELLTELHDAGVDHVWMESRRPNQNMSDLQAVNVFRIQRRIGARLRVDHALPVGPRGEPLLWVPDIVAGVVNGGDLGYRDRLDRVLHEITVKLT
jgi:hypothetical protein